MLNFSEITTQVANMIERPDSAFLTRIQGYVNQRYRSIAKERPWADLCRQFTVPQVVGQAYIIMPNWITSIIDVHQTDTPLVLALQRYFNFLNRHINDLNDTGNPFVMTPVGNIGILTPMPSDSVITIVSSSTSDNTQTIRCRGYNSNSTAILDSIQLNGVTPVNGTVTFSSVGGLEPWFSKSDDTVGEITVKSGSTVLGYMGPKDRDMQYAKWSLWPAPTQANTLYVTAKKDIQRLINPEDTPEIKNSEDCLIQGAYAQALEEKRQFQKAAQAWTHYQDELERLIESEPVFEQNFQDQLMPEIVRSADDLPFGGTAFRVS